MSRTIKNENLQSRSARDRLRQQRKPHWCTLRPGQLHLGYSRPKRGKAGIWRVRTYVGQVKALAPGKRGGLTPYRVKRLPGVADDYEDANGTTVFSFAQAQDLALAPPPTPQPGGPLTVAGAIDAYVASLRDGGRDHAATDVAARMRVHVLSQLGAQQVATLTSEQLRGWLADTARSIRRRRPGGEEAERRSKVSANRTRAALLSVLNHAYREGLVPSDAAWRGRVKPFANVDRARTRFLQVEECRRLINASESAFRLLVQAALHSGARYGELTRLKVHDFEVDGGALAIHRSKSGKPRHVHLTAEGEEFFRQLCVGRGGNERMLLRDNGVPWHRSDQRRPMAEAVERASISPPISFHGLRHTYASLAVMAGVPLMVLAENLGHRDTKMVERHYGHLATSHKREMIRERAPTFGIAVDGKVAPLRH
jgi:integrase